MAYASRSGHARTNARAPEAFAVCQRCGFWYNRSDLIYQYDWTGPILNNLRVLVCTRTCYDAPQEQARTIVLSADPVPVVNPSPEFFQLDEAGPPNAPLVGCPLGIDPRAQMPLVAGQRWAVPVSILSMLSNGTATITVNTNGPHGLSAGAQISVQGLNNVAATGAFSISVTNSTQFTYIALCAIPTASLANVYTRVITLNIGLPYGQTTIPQMDCEGVCASQNPPNPTPGDLLFNAGDPVGLNSGGRLILDN